MSTQLLCPHQHISCFSKLITWAQWVYLEAKVERWPRNPAENRSGKLGTPQRLDDSLQQHKTLEDPALNMIQTHTHNLHTSFINGLSP